MRRASIGNKVAMAAAGLLAAAPAFAQAPKAAPAPAAAAQPKLPYDITADHAEVFNEEHKIIYTGNVIVIQGADRLITPVLTLFFAARDAAAKPVKPAAPGSPAATFGKIDRMEAEGPVYFNTPTQNAKGDHGTYLASTDQTTLTGNVILVQDKNVSTGDRLVIDRITDHYTMYAKDGGKGRVRGVFYQDDKPGAGAPKAQGGPKGAGSARP